MMEEVKQANNNRNGFNLGQATVNAYKRWGFLADPDFKPLSKFDSTDQLSAIEENHQKMNPIFPDKEENANTG